jgi:hypothetical protein
MSRFLKFCVFQLVFYFYICIFEFSKGVLFSRGSASYRRANISWGKISALIFHKETRGGAVGGYFATSRKVAGSFSDGVIGIFHALILPAALLPWV